MGRLHFVALSAVIAISGLVAASTGAVPVAKVRVSLTVRTPTTGLTAGTGIVLVAKAKLQRGYRLQLRRHASNSRVWHPITECASSPCAAGWAQRESAAVTFAARAIHRKGGTRGAIDSIAGTSRAVIVTWYPALPAPPPPFPPPPPPPPPAAVALAGAYCGSNDQGRSTCIDVAAGGTAVTSFATELTMTCTVGFHWELRPAFSDVAAINGLAFGVTYTSTVANVFSTSSFTVTYSIDGKLDTVGNVMGTIKVGSISWDQNGQHVTCPSVSLGWRAKRIT